MKYDTLAEENNTFVACAEEARRTTAGDKSAKRRMECARRRLIRRIIRVCHLLTDDELVCVAEYIVLVTT
jgi:hypothetical protein